MQLSLGKPDLSSETVLPCEEADLEKTKRTRSLVMSFINVAAKAALLSLGNDANCDL